MPKINNAQELYSLNERLRQKFEASGQNKSIITIGMGTCGLAAGAGEIYNQLVKELTARNIEALIRSVGCIGMCVKEPLLDIQLAGQPRITYVNVKPSQVSRIIEEHILNGHAIQEWIIGYVPTDW
jgi:NADP-reducing hydrogenase subunit HndB